MAIKQGQKRGTKVITSITYQGYIKSSNVPYRLICYKDHAYIWQVNCSPCLKVTTMSSENTRWESVNLKNKPLKTTSALIVTQLYETQDDDRAVTPWRWNYKTSLTYCTHPLHITLKFRSWWYECHTSTPQHHFIRFL